MLFELDYRTTVLIPDWRRKVFGLRRRTNKEKEENFALKNGMRRSRRREKEEKIWKRKIFGLRTRTKKEKI